MKITGYSTALFSTWFYVEELGVLFDAGDGVTASLMHKSGSIKHVFISHADRDHLTGLLQFLQLNARQGYPKIYYPSGCGTFPALEEFTQKFDPHVDSVEWIPMEDGSEFRINNDYYVTAFRNGHVQASEGVTKSLSFIVEKRKRKLKPEFASLTGAEIGQLRKENGEDFITDVVTEKVLGYSGDTPVENPDVWKDVQGLIHESTFLHKGDVEPKGNRHSSVEEVFNMAKELDLEFLVLSHFSSRYKKPEIFEEVVSHIKSLEISCPLYLIPPGEIVRDVLSASPVTV